MEDKYNFISENEIKIRSSAVWPYCHFKPGRPVDPAEIDALMNGLIDIHVHGAPAGGWLAGRPTVVHTTMEASREKVAGLVFKEHNTMTNNFGVMINECMEIIRGLKAQLGEEFVPTKLYGGLVLNYPTGGLNPIAVKTALSGYGDCVEIWLPSVSAKWQLDNIAEELGKENKTGSVVSENGELLPEMKEILSIMADYTTTATAGAWSLRLPCVTTAEKFDGLV
jgi:hypothetical protein